jgi:CHAT domain-containing protein/tetratricopeptide (TPR) repeat protein
MTLALLLGGLALQDLRPGETVVAAVEESDPVVETEALARRERASSIRGRSHRLQLDGAGAYHVDLRSHLFDAYLVLRDESGVVLREEDGGWLGSHARLSFELADASGVRVVTICAVDGRTGEYELELTAGAPPELPPHTLREAQLIDARAAAETVERVRGPDHPETADALNHLGQLVYGRGEAAEARTLFERSLAIREGAFGEEHVDTAESLNNLAIVERRQGHLARSRELHERALSIRERVLGPGDEETATSVHNIATLLFEEGRYEEAREYAERALAIRERLFGAEHAQTGRSLANLAEIVDALGDYPGALALHERVLAIREREYGPDHPATAGTLGSLGTILDRLGESDAALPLLERCLHIREVALGPEHPLTAYAMNNLATLHKSTGRYEAARPLLEGALAVLERSLGPEHPITALCLGNLSVVLIYLGNYEDAAPINARVISITERTRGGDHPQLGLAIHNQAMTYQRLGDSERARVLYQRALGIWETSLGADHPRVALCWSNLGDALETLDRLDEAYAAYDRARSIRAAVYDGDHLHVAVSDSNLARIDQLRGDLDTARERLDRSVAMLERSIGVDHPEASPHVARLARVLLDLGRLDEAWEWSRRAVVSGGSHSRRLAWTLSESERLRLASSQVGGLNTLLSVARAHPSEDVQREAYRAVLGWKGQVSRGLLQTRGAVLSSLDDESRAHVERMQELQAELSRMFHTTDPGALAEARPGLLRDELTRLERELSQRSGAAVEAPPFGVSELAAALPPGSAAVDFFVYETYYPCERDDDGSFLRGVQGEPRLVAWVVRAGTDALTRVDLGPAAPVEAATRAHLEHVVRRGELVATRGRALSSPGVPASDDELRALLWDPLAPHLDGAQLVFVSPDTFLGTLPFEVLQLEDGSYLLEHLAFVYLQDISSLSRARGTRRGWDSLFCVGGIDYGRGWRPLPATGAESDEVAALHTEAVGGSQLLLQAREAVPERVVRELARHRVLHLATHGFFQSEDTPQRWGRGIGEFERQLLSDDPVPDVAEHLPGLLSGLVLAGGERLTAEEISFLDLSGVELVVLSACETGLGRAKGGEGMLGLRRSLRQAGARTVISSLWSVEDEATRGLMRKFYARLWRRGEGTLEALRGARLDLLNENRARHDGEGLPSTWGAFVLDGDWE